MKKLVLFCLIGGSLRAAESTTPDELVRQALAGNPELRFYEAQVAALPKASNGAAPEIAQPLSFPSRQEFRNAVLNLDTQLARLYLDEFRFVLAGEVRLKSMEYQAAAEEAAIARDLAARIGALVKMLEQRPAAGVEALIERRILEGAALPFVQQAADASLRASLRKIELNGLLGRNPESALDITGNFGPWPGTDTSPSTNSLLLNLREARLARGLLGLNAAGEVESFAIGGWFTRDGLGAYEAVDGLTRPGTTLGSTPAETKARLLSDARIKLSREQVRRRLSVDAAREVVEAIPGSLIENLQRASELAERQYRVGALGLNLLLEAHREYLNALETRNEALLQAWRNLLDLQLLNLSPSAGGKTTVEATTD